MFQHEAAAKRGKLGPKCERIRAILNAGGAINYQVLSEHESDAEAYQAERRWVAQFDQLTNQTAGGGGMPGAAESQAFRSFMAALKLKQRVKPFCRWVGERDRSTEEQRWYWCVVKEIESCVEFTAEQVRKAASASLGNAGCPVSA